LAGKIRERREDAGIELLNWLPPAEARGKVRVGQCAATQRNQIGLTVCDHLHGMRPLVQRPVRNQG
jgi:hypothetical protein